MTTEPSQFEYQVCYGIADRITFTNGKWLGPDIPEPQRKPEHIQSCPLMWEYLNDAGREGWELVNVFETPGQKGVFVRTYYLRRSR